VAHALVTPRTRRGAANRASASWKKPCATPSSRTAASSVGTCTHASTPRHCMSPARTHGAMLGGRAHRRVCVLVPRQPKRGCHHGCSRRARQPNAPTPTTVPAPAPAPYRARRRPWPARDPGRSPARPASARPPVCVATAPRATRAPAWQRFFDFSALFFAHIHVAIVPREQTLFPRLSVPPRGTPDHVGRTPVCGAESHPRARTRTQRRACTSHTAHSFMHVRECDSALLCVDPCVRASFVCVRKRLGPGGKKEPKALCAPRLARADPVCECRARVCLNSACPYFSFFGLLACARG
jgi:hypothetical protein